MDNKEFRFDTDGFKHYHDEHVKAPREALSERVSTLETAVGNGGSVDARIQNAVNALDASASGISSDSKVRVTVTEANGKITGVNVSTNNIASASDLSSEVSRATAAEGVLQALYNGLNKNDIVAGDKPETGMANTIYRVPGTNSYTDWMYYNGAWVQMTTYDNAIDDEPTANSGNLVKSSGILKATVLGLKDKGILQLFDKAAITSNVSFNNNTGTIKSDTGWFVSGFMEVDPTKRIYLINAYNGRIWCWDKDMNFIGWGVPYSNIISELQVGYQVSGKSFSNTKYVRIENVLNLLDGISVSQYSYVDADVKHMPMEGYKKDTSLELTIGSYNTGEFTGSSFDVGSQEGKIAYRKAIGSCKFDILATQMDWPYYPSDSEGQELFVTSAIESDKSLNNSTGETREEVGWFVSDYIEVDVGMYIHNTSYGNRAYCYDKNKEYIGWGALNNRTVLDITPGDWPSGKSSSEIKYIRIEGQISNISSISFSAIPSVEKSIFGMFKHFKCEGTGRYNYKAFASNDKILGVERVNYATRSGVTFTHPWFLVGHYCKNGKNILLITFHMEWNSNTARYYQIQDIIAYASSYDYVILMGDTNCEDESTFEPTYETDWALFKAAGYDMANNGYFGLFNTFIYENGVMHPLDNIFVKGNIVIKNANVLRENWMNDHFIMCADVIID